MNDVAPYQERIRRKLTEALQPIYLEIKDDSKRHAGHAGHRPEGETHFRVTVVSTKFEGLGLVARHRLVYGALSEEIYERVHSLNMVTLTPQEYNYR